MKLYYTQRSPYARAVRIIALEKKIDLELVTEDLTKKSAGLLQANPLGKVPLLILDNGQALCDSWVICEYLDALKGEPIFIPAGKDRIEVINVAHMAKGLIDVTVSLFYERNNHPNDINEKVVNAKEETIVRTLEYFEKNVSSLEKLNIASVVAASAFGYTKLRTAHLWEKANCPKLKKWYEAINKRPSFMSTIPVIS